MTNLAISAKGVGKRYRIGAAHKLPDSPLQKLRFAAASPFRYLVSRLSKPSEAEILWALRNVDLEVEQGEVLGIVGRNGSGKSTLLKILSRITAPTEGTATIHGRVGSLIEVGTGFHSELSGRENVFMNGAILGMRKREIEAKFDEIVDFSEVGAMIDTPVKRYSSGMRVRLGFAVAAYLEPDILLVDEVLSVGDEAFRQKCVAKMTDLTRAGHTVLFVSHNMEPILSLCTRVMWLDSGSVVQEGDTADVVAAYLAASRARLSVPLEERLDREGNGWTRMTGFSVRDPQGSPLDTIRMGQRVRFQIEFETTPGTQVTNAWFRISFRDQLQRVVLNLWSRHTKTDYPTLGSSGTVWCEVPQWPLAPGEYVVDLRSSSDGGLNDEVENVLSVKSILGDYYDVGAPPQKIGVFVCPQKWSSISAPNAEHEPQCE